MQFNEIRSFEQVEYPVFMKVGNETYTEFICFFSARDALSVCFHQGKAPSVLPMSNPNDGALRLANLIGVPSNCAEFALKMAEAQQQADAAIEADYQRRKRTIKLIDQPAPDPVDVINDEVIYCDRAYDGYLPNPALLSVYAREGQLLVSVHEQIDAV